MDTLFKVVALDDTINSDSAHYELEMDTRRSVNEEEQTLHNPFRDIKLAGRSIPTITSSTIISTSSSLTSSPVPQQSSTTTFCPRCIWRKESPCAERLEYIMSRRGMSKSDAQSIVETEGGACKPIRQGCAS
jgi:hypothetical protein